MKFRDWFYKNDRFLEAYNPLGKDLRQKSIQKLINAGGKESEVVKYVRDFERIRGMPNNMWLKKDGGINNPGMDDPELNISIPVANRNNIALYNNLEDLKKIVDKANDVLSFKPPVQAVRQRMIKNMGLPMPKEGQPVDPRITEIDGYLNDFQEIKSKFNLNSWKEFMMKPSDEELTGMGDKDFSLADTEKKIPDIELDRRYNLGNYDFLEQLQKVIYRIKKIFSEIANKEAEKLGSKELTAEQIGERKMLLQGIEVVVDDDNCIVWNPKNADEAIRIKSAEGIVNPLCNPGWCICWKNSSNQFNKYRYTDNRTFYIVKNKKAEKTHLNSWNFFVIGVEPSQYVITPYENGDRVSDWNRIVGLAPYLEPHKDAIKFQPLSDTEKKIKNEFASAIHKEKFAMLGYDEKELVYDIHGQNHHFGIEILELTPDEIRNKYFGFLKQQPIEVLEWLKKPENRALSNRYFTSVSRMIENDEGRNLFSNTEDSKNYAAFIFERWEKFGENALKNVSRGLFKQLFNLLEQKYGSEAYEEIVKKFTKNKPNSRKALENLESSKRLLIFNSKVELLGIDKVLSNENFKFFFAALDFNDLAAAFKTYGMPKIFSHMKYSDITESPAGWEQILKEQDFSEIIKYLPPEIVGDFTGDTILSSFLNSNDSGVQKIKQFFSSRIGDQPLVDFVINKPNSQTVQIVNFFQMNPERFVANTSENLFNSLHKESYIYILNNLQKHKDYFINIYFQKATQFSDGIPLALVSNSSNPIEIADEIVNKFKQNITPKTVMEILIGFNDPKVGVQFIKEKNHRELFVSKLRAQDYAELVSHKGTQFVLNGFGKDLLNRIGVEIENNDTSSYEKMFNKLKDTSTGSQQSVDNIIEFLKNHVNPFKIAPINHWIETLDSNHKMQVIDSIIENREINLNGREVAWLLHLSPDPYRTAMHLGPDDLQKVSTDATVDKQQPFMVMALNTIMKLSDPTEDPNADKPKQFFKALGEFGRKYIQQSVDAMTGKKSNMTFKMQEKKYGEKFKERIQKVAEFLGIPVD